jgi:hypothetical protein
MVFNPARYWFTKSPFAKLYRQFLWSPAPIAYKFSASSYVASYWAIACGAPCTLIIFFVQAFFYDYLDPIFYAIPPFKILLALIAVFVSPEPSLHQPLADLPPRNHRPLEARVP